ncbi:DUF2771 family protein [Nocardia otitidiscaviarum]|uniref:DUF2771 family protein n=1 Tax=Nocardia otitidiscaviarum TaxID=1823 RepID=UPI0018944A90|nr:DUF2771 family protein [Nocardia otitidiscaviarum]MBF6235992.1 DUF2771 domain-containing protein [Nocardia otitidiscaviarum]
MSKPNARTILALAAAALLVFVAAVATVVALAVRNADEPKPTLTAYAHGKAITVDPYMLCNVRMEDCRVLPADPADRLSADLGLTCPGEDDCRTGTFANLDVPGGYPLQLSFPSRFTDAPWLVRAYYLLPDGSEDREDIPWLDHDKGTVAITVPSSPERKLVGVVVQLLINARDIDTGAEIAIPHAEWSILTAA